jgi:drug/metabolite transporter (DMT)-like permease
MEKSLKADIMLIIVALFWGTSYYLTDLGLASVEVLNLNALRFLIAFALAVMLSFNKLKSVSKETILYSAGLSVILTVVYISATYGVKYTSLSNAGFLSALAVLFTPILVFLIRRIKPERKLSVSVAISFVGIALLTLNDNLTPALGDIFCIICAIFYALFIVLTEIIVKKESVDAYQIGVLQLGFTGLLNLILSFIIETPGLPDTVSSWAAVLILSIFCTGIAFIVQSVAQQYTTASHVGVILTLEPVFAAVVAFALAGEILMPKAYFGAGLLLLSLFIMEINFAQLPFSKMKKNCKL